jgi:acyl carrier protein
MDNFLKHFAEQLDETAPEEVTLDTNFKDLDEWSSMTALSIIAMVDEVYGKKISGNEIKTAVTIQDLQNIVQSK